MKITITGHTSNIGQVLFEHLKKNHTCIGFSKSNGFNLNDPSHMQQLIQSALHSDCLLNLAHIGDLQSEILKHIIDKWKTSYSLKNVITFGTLATKISPELLHTIGIDSVYLKQKQHLDAVHDQCSMQKPFGKQIKYTMLRIANYGPKTGARANEPSCVAEDITKTIDYILYSDLYISNIDLRRI
jgi:hypothetical protein